MPGSSSRPNACPRRSSPSQILVPLACTVLLTIAAIFRVVALYHRSYSVDPSQFYPSQPFPELLDALLLCVPGLMARVGLAGRYPAWREGKLPKSPWAAVNGAKLGNGVV